MSLSFANSWQKQYPRECETNAMCTANHSSFYTCVFVLYIVDFYGRQYSHFSLYIVKLSHLVLSNVSLLWSCLV